MFLYSYNQEPGEALLYSQQLNSGVRTIINFSVIFTYSSRNRI